MFKLSTNPLKSQLRSQLTRSFRTTSPLLVKVGDSVPTVPLTAEKPGNEFSLSDATKSGKSIIVGVPGAFSGACSSTHIPGYLEKLSAFQEKGFKNIYFVSVNDAFVMDAWEKTLVSKPLDQVKFLADPKGEFVDALDVKFDASAFFGNERSKRFAVTVEDGTISKVFVEPENVPVDVSAASNVLANL